MKILSLSSCAGGLERQRQLVVVDFLEHRLNALVVDQQDVFEDEHEPADLLDQIRVLGFQAFHDPLFRGAVGEVEHLRDGIDAAGFFEGLADDVGEAMLQAALDFLDHLGVGLLHVGDALDDLDLLLARQADENFRCLLRRQVRENQRDRLRMLILDERQQVFRFGLLQERERRGLRPAA